MKKNDTRLDELRYNRDCSVESCTRLLDQAPEDPATLYCVGIQLARLGAHPRAVSLLIQAAGALLTSDIEKAAQCFLQTAKLSFFFNTGQHFGTDDINSHFASVALAAARMAQNLFATIPHADKDMNTIRALLDNIWPYERGRQELQGNAFLRPISPTTLQIEPTNYCNLNCAMCGRKKLTRPLGYFDPDKMKGLMDSWSNAAGTLALNHLYFDEPVTYKFRSGVKLFFMGEPLLHPQLDKLIAAVKASGAGVGIQSNGVLFSKPEIRARILAASPDAISISMDGGSPENYEKIRQGATWAPCLNGLLAFARDCAAAGNTPDLYVSGILDGKDSLAAEKERAFLKPLSDAGYTVRFTALDRHWTPEFLDESGRLVVKTPTAVAELSPRRPLCKESFNKLNVFWDGTAAPCCNDINGVLSPGNCFECGVDGVWNGQAMVNLHRSFMYADSNLPTHCRRCLMGLGHIAQ